MSISRRQHAPLFATGLPGWVTDGLRAAGVMIEEWTSPQWRVESSPERSLNALLLFDSRTPASRTAAETAAQRGFTPLNLAPLIHDSVQAAQANSNDPNALPFASAGTRELPVRLQQEIAARGFYWARIADYPYPYQAALCDARDTVDAAGSDTAVASIPLAGSISQTDIFDMDDPEDVFSDSEVAIEDLQNRYALGHALYVPPDLSDESSKMITRCLDSAEFPLLWKTTPATFRGWRENRKRVQFRIQSDDTLLRVRCDLHNDTYQPALELWRGRHLAVVPLQPGDQTVDERALIFQSAARRHQAGLAAFSAAIGWERLVSNTATHAL